MQLVGILALLCLKTKQRLKRTTPISSRGLFWRRQTSVLCPNPVFNGPHIGAFLLDLVNPLEMKELHQLHKHSERLALVQESLSQAWLHGLRAWWQFEESGCRYEFPYVSLLCNAGLLKASVGQRRHLAQCAEPCIRKNAGIHGQADGNEPI